MLLFILQIQHQSLTSLLKPNLLLLSHSHSHQNFLEHHLLVLALTPALVLDLPPILHLTQDLQVYLLHRKNCLVKMTKKN